MTGPEGEEEIIVEEISSASLALTAVDRAAIDAQVATAKQYPRTVSKCLKEAASLACLDEETAGSMFYSVPRAGKMVTGPSTRLAEVMMYSWGNFRADASIASEDQTHITAMGTAFDLEKNIAVRVSVKRRITNKHGKRYNEDMVTTTGMAAISIALRNSVFKVIPRALVDSIETAARKAAVGDIATLSAKREKAIEWFVKAGISRATLFAKLGVADVADIGEELFLTLRGMYNAVKVDGVSIDSMFGPDVVETSEATNKLNDSLRAKAATQATEKTDTAKPAAAAPNRGGSRPSASAAAKPATAKDPNKCPVCFRTDGTHDAEAPCFAEAERLRLLAEDAELAREDSKQS